MLAAAHRRLSMYGKLPFYASMFANAGFPVSADGTMSDELFDSLVISGGEDAIRARITDVLSTGLDELLVMPIAISDAAAEQTRLAKLIGQL